MKYYFLEIKNGMLEDCETSFLILTVLIIESVKAANDIIIDSANNTIINFVWHFFSTLFWSSDILFSFLLSNTSIFYQRINKIANSKTFINIHLGKKYLKINYTCTIVNINSDDYEYLDIKKHIVVANSSFFVARSRVK